MTWNELKAHIEVMDEEQRNASVMIYNIEIDEYFAIDDINFTVGDDVLNDNSPFLEFQP